MVGVGGISVLLCDGIVLWSLDTFSFSFVLPSLGCLHTVCGFEGRIRAYRKETRNYRDRV